MSSAEKERETQVYMAKLSEQAERYDEMVECMKKVAKLDVELTVEERNLLSVGYKNVIGARRASWRIMSSIEQKEESKSNENNVKLIKGYRHRVEEELFKICTDILTIIDEHLIPSSTSSEASVFYYKMKGDYYRYLAEFKTDQDRKDAADQSLKGYETASTTANTKLPSTHPIRLGLALNFSVFYYEIMNSPERACHLAKQALDEAIAELDTLSEESYKDSTPIVQLLRDTLTLWTSDLPEDGAMEAMVKKYQQRFRKFKDEMDRWDELQVRLISQFTNASSVIGRLPVLQDPKNYGCLSSIDGIVDALLAKQMEFLQRDFSSINKTMEELGNTVRSMEKIYSDGKQLVKGGSNQPSTKQLQLRVGLKPSIEDCLNGLRLLCDMHRSEYHLKESLVSGLSKLFWKPRNPNNAQDLSSLQQLLVDQPNIRKEEVEFIFDTILVHEA